MSSMKNTAIITIHYDKDADGLSIYDAHTLLRQVRLESGEQELKGTYAALTLETCTCDAEEKNVPIHLKGCPLRIFNLGSKWD